ncbi:MAG: hypothetical protein ABI534_05625 [Chloroflexota bacterium]
MARPTTEGHGLPEPGPRVRVILGWVGAAVVIAVVAFIVGRPAGDANQPGALASTSPSEVAQPLAIAFGTAMDATTLTVSELASTFRRGDPFTYSVQLADPVGVGTVYVRVDRVGEPPETVQDWSDGNQTVDPSLAVISFQVPADKLLDVFGAGDYEMRISLAPAGTVLALGTFRLDEVPAAS